MQKQYNCLWWTPTNAEVEAEKAEPIQGGTDVRGEGMLALRVEIRHVSEKARVWLVRMAASPVLTGLPGVDPIQPTQWAEESQNFMEK